MNKHVGLLVKVFIILKFFIFIVFVGGVIFLQTSWSKEKIKNFIVKKAEENGLDIEISNIEGILPLKWSLSNVTLRFNDGSIFKLDQLKIRIAIFSLIKNKFVISYFSAREGTYIFSSPKLDWNDLQNLDIKLPKINNLPFSLASRHVLVRKMNFINSATNTEHAASFRGDLSINQQMTKIYADIKISSVDVSKTFSRLFLNANKETNSVLSRLDLEFHSTQSLSAVVVTPFDVDFKIKSSLSGSWNSFKGLIENCPSEQEPIKVAFAISALDVKAPSLPILNDSWHSKSAFLLHCNKDIECRKLSIKSSVLDFNGSFFFSTSKGVERLVSDFKILDLSRLKTTYPINMEGSLQATTCYKDQKASGSITFQDLKIENQVIKNTKLNALASKKEDSWVCSVKGNLGIDSLEFDLKANMICNKEAVKVRDFLLKTGDATLNVQGLFLTENDKLELDSFLYMPNLRIFRSLLPRDSNLDGAIGGEFHITSELGSARDSIGNDVRGHLIFKNVRYFDKLISFASLDYQTDNIFTFASKKVDIEASNLLIKNLFISDLNVRTEQNGKTNPFSLSGHGIWKDKVNFFSEGSWSRKDDNWAIALNNLHGEILRKKFSNAHPFSIEIQPGLFSINSMLMNTGEGLLMLDTKISKENAKISCKAEHLPLDILTISHPGVFLEGTTSFDGMLDASKDKNKGYFNLTLEQIDVSQQGKEDNFQAKGTIQAHLDNDKMQLFAHIYGKEQQFVDATATIPMDIRLDPFFLCPSKKREVSAQITCEGALESIFDFINIGSQKTSGLLTSHLFLSRSAEVPSLQGDINIQNGSYENYISGTRLKKIQATILADNDSLRIQKCSGEGKGQGTFEIGGQMVLNPLEKFPFRLNASINDVKIADFDLLSSCVTGSAYMIGNLERSSLNADLKLTQSTVFISENIPEEIYELDVSYVNRPINLEGKDLSPSKPYPINYDINLACKDPLHITGRGLNSDWKGRLHISGTNNQPICQGKINLVKGDVMFAGKKFDLTQGEITFTDKPSSTAFIKINGNLQLPDMQVQVIIQGPIESPTFTLQSIPYMPTSAILSRVLFNKDIAEINAVQALQLANVIVSMSGAKGPDLLETIRRSIGVDRLTIVGKDGTDEISLQIGWYLTHGVTVSLSQSATSSDVTVEVDLKHGFIFQAETQNQEEGKFSLKWNKNY